MQLFVVFVTGLAMLLSALYVRYRDVSPIWEVVVQAAFYASPILYPIDKLNLETRAELVLYELANGLIGPS